jgi:hypothetical protein
MAQGTRRLHNNKIPIDPNPQVLHMIRTGTRDKSSKFRDTTPQRELNVTITNEIMVTHDRTKYQTMRSLGILTVGIPNAENKGRIVREEESRLGECV